MTGSENEDKAWVSGLTTGLFWGAFGMLSVVMVLYYFLSDTTVSLIILK